MIPINLALAFLCIVSTAFCQFIPGQGLYGSNLGFGGVPYGGGLNSFGASPLGMNPYGAGLYGASPYGAGLYGANPYGGLGMGAGLGGLSGISGYGLPGSMYGGFPNNYGYNSFPYSPDTSGSQASAQSSSNGGSNNNVYGK